MKSVFWKEDRDYKGEREREGVREREREGACGRRGEDGDTVCERETERYSIFSV